MPSSGPHAGKCCVAPPADEYESVGSECNNMGGLPAYLTGSPSSLSAVLFISDIYGWKVPQTRRLADRVAADAGLYVVVADFMEDDFFESPNPDDPYEGLDAYLARHSQSKAITAAAHIIDELKSQGFQGIGVVGFCWGGKIAVNLLNAGTKVDAAVMCHPSFLLVEEIKVVKVPLAILGAEIDDITPPDMAVEFGAILAQIPEVEGKTMVKIFKGGDHGFSTRYDPQDVEAVARAEEACFELLNWFKKYLSFE